MNRIGGKGSAASALRFGVLTIQDLPWPALAGQWRTVEALGFDSLWIADHFADPFRPATDWLDGWTLLAALAGCTTRIRIGTLVTNFIYRNPALIAKQAVTVDHLSGGRLNLGLGATTPIDPSHAMTGAPVWGAPERIRRFREVVEIVDRLLRGGPVDYAGRYYQVAGAHLHPPPVQQPRPPLTIAAAGKTALAIAARFGDAWNACPGEGLAPPAAFELLRRQSAQLDEACAAIGRNPSEIVRSILVGFTADEPLASIGAFRDFVGRYAEIGFSEFIFYYDRPGMAPEKHLTPRMAERLAADVLPGLRRPNS